MSSTLPTSADQERWMERALAVAAEAAAAGEVPVGCVIVKDGVELASGFNEREKDSDPTAHAEVVALRRAAAILGSWRLDDCHLYVTLEPCAMCAGAIVLARIPAVVYGAADPKAGACESLYRLLDDRRLNHRPAVFAGVHADRCGAILTKFFAHQRSLGKK